MKRTRLLAEAGIFFLVGLIFLSFGMLAHSQTIPASSRVSTFSIVKSASTTGTTTAVIAPAANKTFQVTASVASGTGTAAVTVQGSNDGVNFDPITTLTVTTSTDRYGFIRGNITTLSGSTPTLTLTGAY